MNSIKNMVMMTSAMLMVSVGLFALVGGPGHAGLAFVAGDKHGSDDTGTVTTTTTGSGSSSSSTGSTSTTGSTSFSIINTTANPSSGNSPYNLYVEIYNSANTLIASASDTVYPGNYCQAFVYNNSSTPAAYFIASTSSTFSPSVTQDVTGTGVMYVVSGSASGLTAATTTSYTVGAPTSSSNGLGTTTAKYN